MRYWILAGLLLTVGMSAAAQGPGQPGKEKAGTSLKQKVAAADLVVLGKVSQTGLSAASSFDVGVIEVREVLKGEAKTKTVHFKFISSGNGQIAPYGKKGVDGVWILGKKGAYLEAREVLAHLPPQDLNAVKEIIAKPDPADGVKPAKENDK
jgi:hypothetical protein